MSSKYISEFRSMYYIQNCRLKKTDQISSWKKTLPQYFVGSLLLLNLNNWFFEIIIWNVIKISSPNLKYILKIAVCRHKLPDDQIPSLKKNLPQYYVGTLVNSSWKSLNITNLFRTWKKWICFIRLQQRLPSSN